MKRYFETDKYAPFTNLSEPQQRLEETRKRMMEEIYEREERKKLK